MSNGRIFVVGSLHYDVVLNAPHLPARDETVMGNNVQFVCGGKGGNQAVAAAQHGANVSFVGAVGDDFFADALLENLGTAGVETSQVVRCGSVASGMSVAIIEASGEYGAVVASGANQSLNARDITLPENTRLVVLQNEVPESVNIDVAKQTREVGAKVILNAAPMHDLPNELLRLVDFLIVNRVEAETLFTKPVQSKDDALGVLKDNRLPCPTIIVTLGADGLVFTTSETGPQYLPAHEVAVVSNHGAGDAFVGALSAKLILGNELPNALSYASAAAALHVSTPVDGRDGIDRNAVDRFVSDTRDQ